MDGHFEVRNKYVSFLRDPCQLSLFKCDVKTCLFPGKYCDRYVCLLNMQTLVGMVRL